MRRCIAFIFVLLLLFDFLFSQTGAISGRVVSTEGEPLPGANVVLDVPGRIFGAATDANGRYVISNVPAGRYKVSARFVGYKTETKEVVVEVGKTIEVNFELRPTVLELQEVVVTGAGAEMEKLKLGNTVATINIAPFQEAPYTNVLELVQSKIPGVQVLTTGGMVGEGAQIRIRGSASIAQLNDPIIYIDGVRVANTPGFAGFGIGGGAEPNRLDDINPESIERIEVLKGAAAATLYGTQANAGVIQIFTKRGLQGRPRFNFEVQQMILRYPDVFKPNAGFPRTPEQAAILDTIYGTPPGTHQPFKVFERRFMDGLMGTGYGQVYSFSASGGQPGIQYFASLRYQNIDGPFNPKPEYFFGETNLGGAKDVVKRFQFSGTLTLVPSDKFRLKIGSYYTGTSQEAIENNNNIYSPITMAMFGKPERAYKKGVLRTDSRGQVIGVATSDNPFGNTAFATVREGLFQETKDRADHANINLSASYTITQNVSLDATFGVDFVSQRSSNFNPFGWNVDNFVTAVTTGELTVGTRQKYEWTVDTKLIWNQNLFGGLTSQFIAGIQGFRTYQTASGGTGTDFPGPGIEVLNAGQLQTSNSSFLEVIQAGIFVQEQVGYNDYLFFTLGLRFDANSAFGEKFRTARYPKASLSWLPLETFKLNSSTLSSLRLRAAIGQSGQQPGAFDKFTTFLPIRSPDGIGLAPGNLGNQNLKPEVSTEKELGADIGLFSDRVSFEITYWDRVVKDALIPREFAPSGGFYRPQLVNIGELKAHGWDLSLNLNFAVSRNLSVRFFANGAYLWERVTNMGGAPPIKVGGAYPRYRNFIKEGYAPGAFFGPKLAPLKYPLDFNKDGVPDSEEELLNIFRNPVDPTVIAANIMVLGPDGKPLPGGQTYLDHYLGKPMPDWQGSFGFTISFLRRFKLYALFEYKAGNYYVHNLTDAFRRSHPVIGRNIRRAAELEATLLNPGSTPEQRLAAAEEWVKKFVALSPYDGLNEIEKADFVRWRELSLTYYLPSSITKFFGISGASITFAGRNIAIWTKYSGVDPEANVYSYGAAGTFDNNFGLGIDGFAIPLPRQFVFTLRVEI